MSLEIATFVIVFTLAAKSLHLGHLNDHSYRNMIFRCSDLDKLEDG